MSTDRRLEAYASIVVKAGLNLQAGQRLLVAGPPITGGVSLEAAPLVRAIAFSAYEAGARLVEVLWGDEGMLKARFRGAPRDSFGETSAWLTDVICRHAESGGALLNARAFGQDALRKEDPGLVGQLQQAAWRSIAPVSDLVARSRTNYCVISVPHAGWANTVFPGAPAEERIGRLWDALARVCHLDDADPVERWCGQADDLARRCAQLNAKRYVRLRFTGPGTDLAVGLPAAHLWRSGRSTSPAGIPFMPNLPTEEVFTLPHREQTEGTVRATKPVTYGGLLIEGLALTFSEGRLVDMHADRGEDLLRHLLSTDAGAKRLGEVALVPASSAIASEGLVFYDTLFDENAASHIALGTGYRIALQDGDSMSDDVFAAAGGNTSAIHLDLMIGSNAVDVDGVSGAGDLEPIMRSGEWVE